MNDGLKMFLIALVTTVVVQFLAVPYALQLHGLLPTQAQTVVSGPVEPARALTEPRSVERLNAPNLEGMPVAEARERFRDKGIVIIEDGTRPEPSVAPGTVLQQRPAPGAALTNMEIRVVLSKAGDMAPLPAVVGRPVDQATKLLVEAGFEVPPVTFEASEQPKGTVIQQLPNPGAALARGSTVRLVVAEAPAVEVPKLTGKNLSSARKLLEQAGLQAGSVRRQEHAELGEGTVLSQAPNPGERIPPGTLVDLVVVAPN